ncbi:hypothetical protein Ciccas_005264 [Cichlidogyrus casuarinus]|uniref:DNA polymerase kappa n=1 Tax=Cichlidogyrus casuarinus TaxID=1844966 RepID=A0ABD2Q9L0_9PLAT
MEGIDKESINRKITEFSKGSKFYENAQKKDASLKLQIEEKLRSMSRLTEDMLKEGSKEADKLLEMYRSSRTIDRSIVHIDMDAFYAAVEMRDCPELRLKPMAVGGYSMLSTSNYLARRFGVRSAMPGFIAKKLCPELTIVKPDFSKYSDASKLVRSILQEYSSKPLLTMSLDEAYIDITEHVQKRPLLPESKRTFFPRVAPKTPPLVCKCESTEGGTTTESPSNPTAWSDVKEIDLDLEVCIKCGLVVKPGKRVFSTTLDDAVREMRFRVFCATRLTCSAGIGPNSLIAKIASDRNKPNGQFMVEATVDAVETFMADLSVRKVPGIGHVAERKLNAFGVNTCSDLIRLRGTLYHLFTEKAFAYYMRIAIGYACDSDWDEDANLKESNRKSQSVENTFNTSSNQEFLIAKCKELSSKLVADLVDEHMRGKTITLKMKLDTFEIRTRCHTLTEYTDSYDVISVTALQLLETEFNDEQTKLGRPLCLRLMGEFPYVKIINSAGVRISGLISTDLIPKSKQVSISDIMQSAFYSLKPPSPKKAKKSPVKPQISRKRPSNAIEDFFKPAHKQSKSFEKPSCSTDASISKNENLTGFLCPVCNKNISCPSEDKVGSMRSLNMFESLITIWMSVSTKV